MSETEAPDSDGESDNIEACLKRVQDGTMWPARRERYGRFRPKRTDDLRPEVERLIGKRLLWRYAFRGDVDEDYPSQWRWLPDQRHHADLGEAATYWVPEEDIEWEQP